MTVLGLDTSNYTTSIAFLSNDGGENCSRLLPVKPGELGLRQSDAVFHHTKSLPELSGRLFSDDFRRGRQYPAESRGGQLYALLPGGIFPCGHACPMPERAAF